MTAGEKVDLYGGTVFQASLGEAFEAGASSDDALEDAEKDTDRPAVVAIAVDVR